MLIDGTTRVLVQGITGRLAQTETRRMLEYGTKVVAGVVPSRSQAEVAGVPVYDSVRQAMVCHAPDASCLYVPAPAIKKAAIEAIDAGIRLLMIPTERVPLHDTCEILERARDAGARVIGPNSQGVVVPGRARLGGAGGDFVYEIFRSGPVGVVSRSGGMGVEICHTLSKEGIGQSTYISIGSEILQGLSFSDLLAMFEDDRATEATVLFGELGTGYEEEAAELIASGKIAKPVVAYVAGRYMEELPSGLRFGHSGAIIEGDRGKASRKIEAFRSAGVLVANTPVEISPLVRDVLRRRQDGKERSVCR